MKNTVCARASMLAVSLCIVSSSATSLAALPQMFENDAQGRAVPIADADLHVFERQLREAISKLEEVQEIIAIATSTPIDFITETELYYELQILLIYRDRGEVRWLSNYGEQEKKGYVSAQQVRQVREYLSTNAVDSFVPLESTRVVDGKEQNIVSGVEHVYVHINK